ncbi:hypothetical protein [Massilia putida]|uniref:hypothetical protein n=1 Tax=Massilia putida TaxID=1141883 RepID=UPI000952FF4E|nr:hypothetical protein [Massilia putida]
MPLTGGAKIDRHPLQVLEGQGIATRSYHPLADVQDEHEVADYLGDIAGVIAQCVDVMPAHDVSLATVMAGMTGEMPARR